MSGHRLASSLCVLLLHLGLQLVEAGSVRSRSVSSVMMRGLTSLTLTVITTWVCGYCFAFSPGGPMLGTDPAYLVLTSLPSTNLPHFLLYCSLASLPPAILSGCMSERTHLTGHLIISLLLSLIIVPAPAHWLWTSEGWLAAGGCEDQGGPLTLHLLSGCAALLGAVIVGPRLERMGDNFREVSLPGHSLPLTGTGAFLVILGMLGKVVGLSTSQQPHISAQLVVNCLVAGAGGCLLTMTLFKLKTRRTKNYNLATSSPSHSVTSLAANRKWSYLTAFNGFFTGKRAGGCQATQTVRFIFRDDLCHRDWVRPSLLGSFPSRDHWRSRVLPHVGPPQTEQGGRSCPRHRSPHQWRSGGNPPGGSLQPGGHQGRDEPGES